MIAYQLGWLNLILSWEQDNKEGKNVITPAPDYKWNNLGGFIRVFMINMQMIRLKRSLICLVRMFINSFNWLKAIMTKNYLDKTADSGRLQHHPIGQFGSEFISIQ